MHLNHIAIWVNNMEQSKDFYQKYFDVECNDKYVNNAKGFSSYFLSFKESRSHIELMHRRDISTATDKRHNTIGLTHIAISVGGKDKVDELTEKLRADGYTVAGEAHTTGDGYYESVVEDCDGNWVEICE